MRYASATSTQSGFDADRTRSARSRLHPAAAAARSPLGGTYSAGLSLRARQSSRREVRDHGGNPAVRVEILLMRNRRSTSWAALPFGSRAYSREPSSPN